ncbi:CoA pyrophosphatase [soil metagenome]
MSELATLRAALAARPRETLHLDGFRRAAVLVPVLQGAAGLELLFTVRASGLSSHASQISFPGGRVDAGETVDAAAQRETFEEVGLTVPSSALLGHLDEHPSPARYIVTPVVAALAWPQTLTLNPAEVADTFTVPLDVLLDLEPYTEERQLQQYRRLLHFYPYQKRLIWGLTGNVLKSVLDLFRAERVGAG